MARNNAYRVNRPNYKARMEANEYRDYLNEKRKETNRLKKIETDNLYNENTFGGNVWRNTKKFASVALPALIGYGLLKGKHVALDSNDGPGMFALKALGAGISAAPAVAAGAAIGVVPYTFARQMEAENSRRDEAYEQFKHMQNKVLAENNLLNYQAPKSNLPGSKFFPRAESQFSPYNNKGDYSEILSSVAKVAGNVATNVAKGAGSTAKFLQTGLNAGNVPITIATGVGAATAEKELGKSKLINGITKTNLNEKIPYRDASETEEVADLSDQLMCIKSKDPSEYELRLERALDTLSEDDKTKLLELIGQCDKSKVSDTPCLDKILSKSFSEEKVGENASEYAKIPITPNFGKVPDLKDEVLSDATLDFRKKEEKKNNGEIKTTKTVETSVTKTSSPTQTSVSVGFSECSSLKTILFNGIDNKIGIKNFSERYPNLRKLVCFDEYEGLDTPNTEHHEPPEVKTPEVKPAEDKPKDEKPVKNNTPSSSSSNTGGSSESSKGKGAEGLVDAFLGEGASKKLMKTTKWGSRINAAKSIFDKATSGSSGPARFA